MVHVGVVLLKFKNTCFLNLKCLLECPTIKITTCLVKLWWPISGAFLSAVCQKLKKNTVLAKYYRNSCEVRIAHWNLGNFSLKAKKNDLVKIHSASNLSTLHNKRKLLQVVILFKFYQQKSFLLLLTKRPVEWYRTIEDEKNGPLHRSYRTLKRHDDKSDYWFINSRKHKIGHAIQLSSLRFLFIRRDRPSCLTDVGGSRHD